MLKILRFVLLVVLLCAFMPNIPAEELKREEGLSVHVVPKRVAEIGGENSPVKWGFMVSQSQDLKPPLERPVFQTAEHLLAYYFKQPKKIQENGIWMILTHPNAYSEGEKQIIENLKSLCKVKGIPLSICRGMDLPDGWKRN